MSDLFDLVFCSFFALSLPAPVSISFFLFLRVFFSVHFCSLPLPSLPPFPFPFHFLCLEHIIFLFHPPPLLPQHPFSLLPSLCPSFSLSHSPPPHRPLLIPASSPSTLSSSLFPCSSFLVFLSFLAFIFPLCQLSFLSFTHSHVPYPFPFSLHLSRIAVARDPTSVLPLDSTHSHSSLEPWVKYNSNSSYSSSLPPVFLLFPTLSLSLSPHFRPTLKNTTPAPSPASFVLVLPRQFKKLESVSSRG